MAKKLPVGTKVLADSKFTGTIQAYFDAKLAYGYKQEYAVVLLDEGFFSAPGGPTSYVSALVVHPDNLLKL